MGLAASRTLLVSGAASGIGEATARLFIERGWMVVAIDRDRTGLERLVQGVGRGERLRTVAGDVTQDADVRRAVGIAEAEFGGLDGLLTAAGTLIAKPVEETSEADWDRVQTVNLKGTFLCCRSAIPALRRRGGGAIVTMGSIYAQASVRGMAAYAASKGGVLALTRQLALELGPDRIRVNCILAGAIDTPLLRSDPAIQQDARTGLRAWALRHPLGRVGEPREVAALVFFLTSDEASFMTGAGIPLDGGALTRAFSTE